MVRRAGDRERRRRSHLDLLGVCVCLDSFNDSAERAVALRYPRRSACAPKGRPVPAQRSVYFPRFPRSTLCASTAPPPRATRSALVEGHPAAPLRRMNHLPRKPTRWRQRHRTPGSSEPRPPHETCSGTATKPSCACAANYDKRHPPRVFKSSASKKADVGNWLRAAFW
mgnify:FL=1